MRFSFSISIAVATVVVLLAADRIAKVPSATAFYMPMPSSTTKDSLSFLTKSQLFAKPRKEKERRKNIANSNRNFETAEASPIPANLKRKVDAKRPPLGHVVPEDTRAKGCEFFLPDHRVSMVEFLVAF